MRIRPARPEDVKAIAEVHVAAWQAAYRGLMPDSYLDELTVEKRTDLWQRLFARPHSSILVVAETEASLDGFCFFGPSRDADAKDKPVGEIVALNVRPGQWRSGFGRALCEFALHEALVRKWNCVTLWVLKGNNRARRFYEALGFALDGCIRTDTKLIGSPIHELRYGKTTASAAG